MCILRPITGPGWHTSLYLSCNEHGWEGRQAGPADSPPQGEHPSSAWLVTATSPERPPPPRAARCCRAGGGGGCLVVLPSRDATPSWKSSHLQGGPRCIPHLQGTDRAVLPTLSLTPPPPPLLLSGEKADECFEHLITLAFLDLLVCKLLSFAHFLSWIFYLFLIGLPELNIKCLFI